MTKPPGLVSTGVRCVCFGVRLRLLGQGHPISEGLARKIRVPCQGESVQLRFRVAGGFEREVGLSEDEAVVTREISSGLG